jgi:Tfp pilus assembly protein PilN
MSELNLWPWREQQKQAAKRRWLVGSHLALCLAGAVAWSISSQMHAWQQDHAMEKQRWIQAIARLNHAIEQDAIWQSRERQTKAVHNEWMRWQQQQQRAWQVLRHILAAPPGGVQVTHMAWRDKQLHISGWAVSQAHLSRWQESLQAQRVQWHEATWRQVDGLSMRQHAFELIWDGAVTGGAS